MKDRYSELWKPEVLKVAANYFLDDVKDNFIPDLFHHQDFIFNLNSNLKMLARRIRDDRYRPQRLLEIDVPKTGLSVRPGSVLEAEDHVVYFAMAYLLAPLLDDHLPPNVYHYRVKKKGRLPDPTKLFENREPELDKVVLLSKHGRKLLQTFEDWYEAWPDFVQEAQAIFEQQGYDYLVETDISSYFENISHPLLADVLVKYAPEQIRLVNFLRMMLSEWATTSLLGNRPERGIPQGNNVSSWLGTLYLIPLDLELLKLEKKGKVKYIRYVDDIRVFTKDRETARTVVFLINRLLRQLHLNMQGSKTEIVEKVNIKKRLNDQRIEVINDILERLTDQGEDISNEIQQEIRVKVKPLYIESIVGKTILEKRDHRFFKRCITLFSQARSPIAINECIQFLLSDPVLTAKIMKYLHHWENDNAVVAKILNVLLNHEIFDSQYLSLLPFVRRSVGLSVGHKKFFWNVALNMDLHWSVRSEAFLSLAVFSLSDSECKRLIRRYDNETSPFIQKAILAIMLQAKDRLKRPFLEETIFETDYLVNRFRKYLWALVNSNQLSVPTLLKLAEIEKDPAKICVALQAALQSSNKEILKTVREIATQKEKMASSNVACARFGRIKKDSILMLNDLAQGRFRF